MVLLGQLLGGFKISTGQLAWRTIFSEVLERNQRANPRRLSFDNTIAAGCQRRLTRPITATGAPSSTVNSAVTPARCAAVSMGSTFPTASRPSAVRNQAGLPGPSGLKFR